MESELHGNLDTFLSVVGNINLSANSPPLLLSWHFCFQMGTSDSLAFGHSVEGSCWTFVPSHFGASWPASLCPAHRCCRLFQDWPLIQSALSWEQRWLSLTACGDQPGKYSSTILFVCLFICLYIYLFIWSPLLGCALRVFIPRPYPLALRIGMWSMSDQSLLTHCSREGGHGTQAGPIRIQTQGEDTDIESRFSPSAGVANLGRMWFWG